jgi:hypothetical protein
MNSGASFPYPSVKINLWRQAAARQWKILWFASLRCSGRAASNEKEISHGRVSWQTLWSCIEMGPLASSIG